MFMLSVISKSIQVRNCINFKLRLLLPAPKEAKTEQEELDADEEVIAAIGRDGYEEL